MKTIKTLVFAVLCVVSTLLTSCVRYVDQETGRPLAGPNNPYGQEGARGGERTGSDGRRVIGQKKIAHTHTVKPFVKVGADAPKDVCEAVSESTANEVSLIAQKSVRPGQKPVWPSWNDVTGIAGSNFARLGYPLSPGSEGQPGCFKVMVYKTGM